MPNRYACVNTKLMAMKGALLKEADYADLIAAENIADVCQLLNRNVLYAPELADLDLSAGYHRQEVEWRLKRLQIHQSEKFFYYLSETDKKLVDILLRPLEIAALCKMIRSLAVGEDLKEVLPGLVWSKRCAAIDFESLAESKTWSDFKTGLKKTPYYRICEIYSDIESEQDRFFIEKSFERAYYDNLNQVLSAFKGKENQKMVETFRREIDLINLIWLYRGKFHYHLSRETLIAYTLHGGQEIIAQKILNMVDASDLKTFTAQIDMMPAYHFLFNHEKTLDLYMERRRSRYLYYAFQKLFRQSTGAGKMAAYIRLVGFEIQDVISIIESKRYNLTAEETEAFLIRSF